MPSVFILARLFVSVCVQHVVIGIMCPNVRAPVFGDVFGIRYRTLM